MKYQQQMKKKERPFWWDADQSDSDGDWDECISETAPFFKRTSGRDEQIGYCHESMGKRNCTPVAGLNLRTAIFKNSNVTSHGSELEKPLLEDESFFPKQNAEDTALRNNNMGKRNSSHQIMFNGDRSRVKSVHEQSSSTETKTTDKDDAALMPSLFKESRVNSKGKSEI